MMTHPFQSALLATLVGAMALSPVARAAEGILKNPGFEADANADGNPDYWFVYPGIRELVVDPEVTLVAKDNAPEGSVYLRLSKRGGKPLALTHLPDQAALEKLFGGMPRAFTVKAKGRANDLSGDGAAIVVQVFHPDENGVRKFAGRFRSEKLEGTTEWVSREVVVSLVDILPEGTLPSDVEINLELGSDTGSVDFDDFSVVAQ